MLTESVVKKEWVEATLTRLEKPLVRYAIRLTGNLETAQEAVRDTFLLLCKANRSDVQERLASWLFLACRDRAQDIRKREFRRGHQQTPLTRLGPGIGKAAAQPVKNRKQALALRVLSELTDPQQEALRLKLQDGLTYTEIALLMGRSLSAVENLMTAALTSVRNKLKTEIELAHGD